MLTISISCICIFFLKEVRVQDVKSMLKLAQIFVVLFYHIRHNISILSSVIVQTCEEDTDQLNLSFFFIYQ